jgi:hypothetical protein
LFSWAYAAAADPANVMAIAADHIEGRAALLI